MKLERSCCDEAIIQYLEALPESLVRLLMATHARSEQDRAKKICDALVQKIKDTEKIEIP